MCNSTSCPKVLSFESCFVARGTEGVGPGEVGWGGDAFKVCISSQHSCILDDANDKAEHLKWAMCHPEQMCAGEFQKKKAGLLHSGSTGGAGGRPGEAHQGSEAC